jgi:hypothetical protein
VPFEVPDLPWKGGWSGARTVLDRGSHDGEGEAGFDAEVRGIPPTNERTAVSYTLLNEDLQAACEGNPDLQKALANVQVATTYTEKMPAALSQFEAAFQAGRPYLSNDQFLLIDETLNNLKRQYLFQQ